MAAKREQGGISTKSAENKILDGEQKEFALRAEISRKDMEIFKLTENRKFLEDEIAAIKHTLAHDKERWEHETEQNVVTIKSLERKVQVYINAMYPQTIVRSIVSSNTIVLLSYMPFLNVMNQIEP
jgi:chorismate mutase